MVVVELHEEEKYRIEMLDDRLNFSYKQQTQSTEEFFIKKEQEIFDSEGFKADYIITCAKTQGLTITNTIRRTALSEAMSGFAPVAFKLSGAKHQFDIVSGIKETMIEISLNLKKLVISAGCTDQILIFAIKKNKHGIITAGDLICTNYTTAEIINTDLKICTLDQKKSAELVILVCYGNGYVPWDKHEFLPRLDEGFIALDSIFSPVVNCAYEVETVTGGKKIHDRVKLELSTNGSIAPDDVMSNILKEISIHKTVKASKRPIILIFQKIIYKNNNKK